MNQIAMTEPEIMVFCHSEQSEGISHSIFSDKCVIAIKINNVELAINFKVINFV
jgi:hypothetical protein